MDNQTINQIEQRLGYCFGNKQLLVRAFTHSSFANVENVPDNERMEFFGDAILEYLTSEYLFEHFPRQNEGQLSAMRSKLVSAEGLRPAVDRMGLLEFLQALNNDFSRKAEANLFESVLCAIYLDGGLAAAKQFFLRALQQELDNADGTLQKDPKTLLQEYCQRNKLALSYRLADRSGPDNKPRFRYEILVDGVKQSEGEGSSKKAAEQDAANKLVTKWRIDRCYI